MKNEKTRLTVLWVVFVGLLACFVWVLMHPDEAQAAKPEIQNDQSQVVTFLGKPNKETKPHEETTSEKTLEERLRQNGFVGFADFAPQVEESPAEEN